MTAKHAATADQSVLARVPARPQLLDGPRLLAWLDDHAAGGSLVRRAVYEGAAARIRRGDFNAEVNA